MSLPSSRVLFCAGLSLLFGLTARTEAGDFFHRLHGDCNASCASQTVQLPAQQIVVEAPRPRVVVQDSIRLSSVAQPPVVASFFVPMPLQMGVVGTQSL